MPVDVIANESRLAVARRLGQLPAATAPELAEATGLHLNTVRAHLGALERHGVAERVVEPAGRPGRPPVRYRLRRPFVPDGDELLPLSALLATALAGLGPGAERVREVGLDWGRRWSAAEGGEEPLPQLRRALERLGFAVEIDGDVVRLSACPCPNVAPASPGMICELADAVIDGVLESSPIEGGRRRHDPRTRHCSAAIAAP